jgi:hypothetical protein
LFPCIAIASRAEKDAAKHGNAGSYISRFPALFALQRLSFDDMGARSLVTAVLCLLAFFAIQVAGSSQEKSNLTLADIPPCGVC